MLPLRGQYSPCLFDEHYPAVVICERPFNLEKGLVEVKVRSIVDDAMYEKIVTRGFSVTGVGHDCERNPDAGPDYQVHSISANWPDIVCNAKSRHSHNTSHQVGPPAAITLIYLVAVCVLARLSSAEGPQQTAPQRKSQGL
jgi:hypothetical protein